MSRHAFSLLLVLCLTACHRRNTTAGNRIRFPIESDPPTLDTVLMKDHVSFEVAFGLHEGLTRLDEKMRVVPGLSESWTVSPDGKIYRFRLRHAHWSDGVPVKAKDFVFAWRRLLDPLTASEYAYFLFDLENAQEFSEGKLKDFSKVGVSARDDRTLEIRLKAPAAYFLNVPSFALTAPQREDLWIAHPKDFTEPPHCLCTGPYCVTQWRHDDKVTLEPNPYYWGEKPAVTKIEFLVVKEDSTALSLYEHGDLDVAMRLPSLDITRLKNRPDYRSVPVLRGYYYGFSVKTKPFDNPLVRKAFAHAIDRREIVRALKGGQVATNSWVPKGMFGYEEEIGLPYDPQKARRYLAQAGYPKGRRFPVVTAMFDSLELNRLVAEKLQHSWKTVLGIPDVRLETQEWKVYLDTLTHSPPPIFRMGWGADYPDPHNFLDIFTSVSGNNNTGWKNRRFDALLAEGAKVREETKRRPIYQTAQRLLLEEDAVIIPLFQTSIEMLVKPHVKGFFIDAIENPRFAGASVVTVPVAE